MSVYFYAVCQVHAVKCPAFTGSGGGLCGDESLVPFLFRHRHCTITFCTDDVDDAVYDKCASEVLAAASVALNHAGLGSSPSGGT